jgi:hypothetical protein
MPTTWSAFRRRDVSGVVRIVHDIAARSDPGLHGHGVDVVLESPHRHWWGRLLDRVPRDQARIAVTREGGLARYPIHVRLRTGQGARAVRRIERRDRWATGTTTVTAKGARGPETGDGEATLVLKRGLAGGYRPDDAAREVVAGTVSALLDLHPFTPDRGWRARVDRDVRRH